MVFNTVMFPKIFLNQRFYSVVMYLHVDLLLQISINTRITGTKSKQKKNTLTTLESKQFSAEKLFVYANCWRKIISIKSNEMYLAIRRFSMFSVRECCSSSSAFQLAAERHTFVIFSIRTGKSQLRPFNLVSMFSCQNWRQPRKYDMICTLR